MIDDPALQEYVALEKKMLALEAAQDIDGADKVRDALDGVWLKLDEASIAWLSSRLDPFA